MSFKNAISQGESSIHNQIISYKIDPNETFQTIDNFGASDAWSCQFVGEWPRDKKEKIASLLFSKEVDLFGNPKGIGLSLWRFNLGAGSSEQGKKSGISDEWRRAESFLQNDGSYNWKKQGGQVWFAKTARDYDVEQLLIFLNSPHVNFTRNGKAFSTSDKRSNLPKENYKGFTDYITYSIAGMKNLGLKVDLVSPFNEPQWDWEDGGQEGTPYWNKEIAEISKYINQSFEENIISTKIDIAEAAQINYLWENDDKSGRGNQIEDFFNPKSKNYIGNLSNLSHTISGHSYFTTSPENKLFETRKTLAEALQKNNSLQFWMSEYCILGDNDGEINGSGRDLGIDPAIYMAKVIYHDLVVAQASAWHWWLAISPYDYKDGLIYIDKNKIDGNFYESKMLWALGNYSRFIRPGAMRVKIESTQNQSKELFTSAYLNENNIVIIIVNSSKTEKIVNFKLNNKNFNPSLAYTTSSTKDLEKKNLKQTENIKIPARSIVTLVDSQ